jgi:hypothetical protein
MLILYPSFLDLDRVEDNQDRCMRRTQRLRSHDRHGRGPFLHTHTLSLSLSLSVPLPILPVHAIGVG